MKTHIAILLRIALGAVLLLFAGLPALQMIPPRAVSAEAPATRFSAERAMSDLQVVAGAPHAAGSDAQAKVRAYIVGEVKKLGLEAAVETSGEISNILVRLAGTDSTQTVLVTGHYDSHPPAPGAGDDGLSSVAMLETMRVLHASPALRNDVLFLFSDGEELGYLGAYAYLKMHPEAMDETGVMLCFDGLPGNAPLALMETSPEDGWLIRQMVGLPLSMYAGSWTNRAERGEIDTDCSVFMAAGYTGVEFENAETGASYHTSNDTVEAISANMVQSFGKTMLALAGHFGKLDLRTGTHSPDLAYITLPLLELVAYPGWVMPVLSGLGLLALLVFVALAWRQGRLRPGRFALGLLGLLVGIVLIAVCTHLAWGAILKAHAPAAGLNAGFDASAPCIAGLMLAAGILMVGLLTLLSRRLGAVPVAAAAILVYLAIGFVFRLFFEGDNPLTTAWLAWPFLGCVAGMGVLLFARKPAWKAVLLAGSALLLLTAMVPQLWLASYTREDAWIPVLVVCAWEGLFAPQVEAIFGRALQQETANIK
jgi:hypothetical protein